MKICPVVFLLALNPFRELFWLPFGELFAKALISNFHGGNGMACLPCMHSVMNNTGESHYDASRCNDIDNAIIISQTEVLKNIRLMSI